MFLPFAWRPCLLYAVSLSGYTPYGIKMNNGLLFVGCAEDSTLVLRFRVAAVNSLQNVVGGRGHMIGSGGMKPVSNRIYIQP